MSSLTLLPSAIAKEFTFLVLILVWQHRYRSLIVLFLKFHLMLWAVCVLPLSSFILWAILCTDRALIDLAVDMASRVWCRSYKATRKNAQNISWKKKKSAILTLCWIISWTHCSDLLWYIDKRRATLTNPRMRLQRDIFNMQTTHCSNSAWANFVVAGPLLCAVEPPVSLCGRAWLQWNVFGEKTYRMASTGLLS